jgi:hypothetical protein
MHCGDCWFVVVVVVVVVVEANVDFLSFLHHLRIPTSSVPVDVLKTHPNYDAMQREYHQLVQSIESSSSSKRIQQTEEDGDTDHGDPRMPVTVVDFFAGIGSGTVALKRLGIAMKKVSG